jgi:hypothetical protein
VTGVPLRGYAIKDRVVVKVYDYTPIKDPDLKVAVADSSDGMFTVEPIDYNVAKIPKNTISRFRITIKVSSKSAGLPEGAVVDVILPTGFEAYPNCINDIVGGSQILTYAYKKDYLVCSVAASTTNPFNGLS